MKILHTADWHLGKKLNGFSRHAEQVAVLQEIVEIAREEKVDLVLVAGDLFDGPNPPTESIELFYQTLHRLSRGGSCAVVAIAGNHDSPERIEAPEPLALANGIVLAGFPDSVIPAFETEAGIKTLATEPGVLVLSLPHVPFPVRLLMAPFANELRLRKAFSSDNPDEDFQHILKNSWARMASGFADSNGVNLMIGHLYFVPASGERVAESDDERSIEGLGGTPALPTHLLPEGLHYVALGHIHKAWTLQTKPYPVRYSSSPLSYSLNEAGQTKQVVLLEAEPGKPVRMQERTLISGKPVLKKFFTQVPEALQWLYDNPDVWVEVTIESETYLKSDELRSLQQAHSGIIDLVPQVKSGAKSPESDRGMPNLDLDKESLFSAFFNQKKGIPPSEEIQSLFRELLRNRG